MRPKINFYCIGAQKSGTTTLHDILKGHYDVYLPIDKEAHFFHKDELYSKGVSWYLKTHFSTYDNQKIVGSITPEYLFWKVSPERIYKTFGSDIKFVVILRNPVDRAYSHYLMSVFRGFENLEFHEAIAKEKDRIQRGFFEMNHFSYISRGLYNLQLERYLEYYNINNILLIHFEKEFIRKREETIKKICHFLNIKTININTDIRSNVALETKSKTINQILRKPPKSFQIISRYFPSDFKKNVRYIIEKLNSKVLPKKELPIDFKRNILTNYFIEDIEKLRTNFNFDVGVWWNDNKL